MTVFVDTSAVCALLDRVDPRHPAIAEAFTELTGHPLLTHSYVVLESTALVERSAWSTNLAAPPARCPRSGRRCARRRSTHEAALGTYLAASTGDISLVDATSFEVMRTRGITKAFALDRHFADAGFELIP